MSARRPPWVSRAIWEAYGDRYPGGYRRWLDQQAERDAWAVRVERIRIARALRERAHRKPVAA